MNKDLLLALGLNELEATSYLALLEHGTLSVSELSKNTKISRTNLYNVITALISKGVVEEVNIGKVARFQAQHPRNLLDLVSQKEKDIEESRKALELLLPSLQSLYKLTNYKPAIQVFEGIEGLKKIYADILRTKSDILLFRSVYDFEDEKMKKLVRTQIDKQVRANIHVRAIAPFDKTYTAKAITHDEQNLVTRKIVSPERFSLPAQILIYANKVAITDLKSSARISTLIENDAIAGTFRGLFEYIWETSETEDKEYRDQLAKGIL
jgi:sugar-specific transcriptional regulator TrmB